MAVGDTVSDIQDVPLSNQVAFQPAAGVEVLITQLAAEGKVENSSFELYDGTLAAIFYTGLSVPSNGAPQKLFINNTNYLLLKNTNAGAAAMMGYTGIQTK